MSEQVTVLKKRRIKVPKVLEERLLLDKDHRKILDAMVSLSPSDTGNIFFDPTMGFVPTSFNIAQETGLKTNYVQKKMQEIRGIWEISDSLPTANGDLSEEQALVSALTNQAKQRWDPEIKDYRVARIHYLTGEMGFGTEYTNNKAFEGERILRNALGWNERINAYYIQGGIMPRIVSFFGKNMNSTALMTGINKSGKEASAEEKENLVRIIERAQNLLNELLSVPAEGRMTVKQLRSLQKYVVNTMDSWVEAAESVAHEMVPVVKDIANHAEVHLFYSGNDLANLSQLEDIIVAGMKTIFQESEKAKKRLPILKAQLPKIKRELGRYTVRLGVADYIRSELDGLSAEKKTEAMDAGAKAFREYLTDNLFKERGASVPAKLKKLKAEMRKRYFEQTGERDKAEFNRTWQEARHRYFDKNISIKGISDVITRQTRDMEDHKYSAEALESTKDEIKDLGQFVLAGISELSEGHAWFTKKKAITPTLAKAKRMLEKSFYKSLFENILIPKLVELTGKPRDMFRLHTDTKISLFVKDPTAQLGMNEYSPNLLYGTISTHVPMVDVQRSKVAKDDSCSDLQRLHESAIADRVAHKLERPRYIPDFDKRRATAFSRFLLTSHGRDGARALPKFVIAPTQVEGEYELLDGKSEVAFYFKVPTRHDLAVLGDLLDRGNIGTVEGKRLSTGGTVAGSMVFIDHADLSSEAFIFGDTYHTAIADKYGAQVADLEAKIAGAKSRKKKAEYRAKLQDLYKEIAPDIRYLLGLNDEHLGAPVLKGRMSNIDSIKSTQLAALQSVGMNRITAALGSEILHGRMQVGDWGFDSTIEGQEDDPVSHKLNLELLRRGLEKKGFSQAQVQQHLLDYVAEEKESQAYPLDDQQLDLFRLIQQPILLELMDNGIIVVLGSGNHHNTSHKSDEARMLAQTIPRYYQESGKLHVISTSRGQAFSLQPIKIPSADGKGIDVVFSHQLWRGKQEVSAVAVQMLGNKAPARIYVGADRHHPGLAYECGRYVVIDVAKQPAGSYQWKTGQATSVHGTSLIGYDYKGANMLSQRFYIDDVANVLTNWTEKAKRLKENHEILGGQMAERAASRRRVEALRGATTTIAQLYEQNPRMSLKQALTHLRNTAGAGQSSRSGGNGYYKK